MQGFISKRNWWIVLVVGGVLAIAVTLIQQSLLPEYDFAAFLIAIGILGIAFFGVYAIDKQGLWSQIPALAMLVLLVTGFVGYFTPKDASGSSPYGVITLGLGAAFMGVVIKQRSAKLVMYCIAIITLLVGDLMLPVDMLWKVVLIVVEVLLLGYLIWRSYRLFKQV
jgi:hypothetical protein